MTISAEAPKTATGAGREPSGKTKTIGVRPLVVGMLATLVVIGAMIFLAVPSSRRVQRTTFQSLEAPRGATSVADVEMSIDGFNAAEGTMRIRLVTAPTDATPPSGVTVLTSIPGASAMVVRPDQVVSEKAATVPFASGDVADYPFDKYRVGIEFLVLKGATASPEGVHVTSLPFKLVGTSTLAGITETGKVSSPSRGGVMMDVELRRSAATQAWVYAMMAIYWCVALLVAGITLAVVTGRRSWAPLLLSWLSATIFALISFRAAAPGSPPMGTFFDHTAVFEGIGIVSVCFVVLATYYLVQRRERLEA